jgi:DNA-binding NarL/FixJ family response regulator
MNKRLLVVDDEPNLLLAVAAILRAEGYEVATARSGKEALLRVAQSIPDLIVSDIRMPVMDGYALARQLRAASHTSLISIVFLTAKDETSDRIAGFRAGIDAYLTKLLAVIASILERVTRTHSQIAQLIGSTPTEEPREFAFTEELTEAEWRVAEAVSRSLSNKEIAAEFNISVRTVENHISHILTKMNFNNRVEIARFVIEQQSRNNP